MTDETVEWRTTLRPSDAPNGNRLNGTESKENYYQRLAVANTLDWNGKWRDESRVTEKNWNALIDSLAGQLSLTEFQRERARRYYKTLPNGMMQTSEDGAVLLSLIVCGLSGREDGRNYHPNNVRADPPTTRFGKLAAELGFSYQKLYSTWKRVAEVVRDE